MKKNDAPFELFSSWYLPAKQKEACGNAMVLATVGKNGHPSSRVVLLAEHSVANGFVFYTDYTSQKGQEIAENPHVSLVFYWPDAYQQVRIEGVASKTTAAMSDSYFYNRNKEKQLSATLSHQSQRQETIDALRLRYEAEIKELANKKITRPETWGGFQVMPNKFEFWEGSLVRMHSRTVFELNDQGEWQKYFLQP